MKRYISHSNMVTFAKLRVVIMPSNPFKLESNDRYSAGLTGKTKKEAKSLFLQTWIRCEN